MIGKSGIVKCWVAKAKQAERHRRRHQVYFKEKEPRNISLSVLISYLLSEPQTLNVTFCAVMFRALSNIIPDNVAS